MVLVAASVFVMVRKGGFGRDGGDGASRTDGARAASQVSYESLPIAELVARSAELLPVVRETIVKSESGEWGAEALRGGERSLDLRTQWRKRYLQASIH